MPTYTWDHVHLRSPDPEATAAWFERILGAEVIRSVEQGKPRIDLQLGGARVFIAPVPAGGGVLAAPAHPHQGLDHFGLLVTGIDAIAAELEAKGARFTQKPTTVRPGVRVCCIEGPEGGSVESRLGAGNDDRVTGRHQAADAGRAVPQERRRGAGPCAEQVCEGELGIVDVAGHERSLPSRRR